MKVLFIGQAPGRTWGDGSVALGGRGGAWLAKMAGMTFPAWLELTDRLNVLGFYPGKGEGKGDRFPRKEAAEAAANVAIDGRRVVYVGREVARAFGHKKVELFAPLRDARAQAAWCIPHPSAINRWWNVKANQQTARTFLRSILELDPVEGTTEV